MKDKTHPVAGCVQRARLPDRPTPGRRAKTPISRAAFSRTCRCAATDGCRWRRSRTNCSTLRQSYLWSLARIPRATSMPAAARARSCIRITPDGQGQDDLAELDALEIHAIAVDSQGSRVCRHIARWQGLSHHRQRQAGSVLRPEGEVHLGAGVRCSRQSVCRRRGRPGRTAPRDAGR